MKLNIPKRLSRDDLQGKYEDDLDIILDSIGDFQENSISAFRQISPPAFKQDIYKNGVEKRIRSPLPIGTKCKGIRDVYCLGIELDSNGNPTTGNYQLRCSTVSWRSLGQTDDGGELLGVTVNYDKQIGDHVSSYIPVGSAVTISATATDQNVTSISLTPGEWDVTMMMATLVTSGTLVSGSINDVSNTLSSLYSDRTYEYIPSATTTDYKTVANVRFSLTSTTNIYMVVRAVFVGGTHYAFGRLSATRLTTDPTTTGSVKLVFFGE